MTSMRSVATAGSVSGSRLVTQNLLLGLDSGWMTGLWTVTTQRQQVLRLGGEEKPGAGGGPREERAGASGQLHGEAWLQASSLLRHLQLSVFSRLTPRPLSLCTCQAVCLKGPSQPSPPGLAPACAQASA